MYIIYMQGVSTKVENIETMLSTIDKIDPTICKNIENKILAVEILLDEIEKEIISNSVLSEKKVIDIENDRYITKKISSFLFPYYWFLCTQDFL